VRPVGEWSVGKSYGAVVSSSPADSSYPGGADDGTIEAYGGHLVAESISTEHRQTIAALPDLIRACQSALKFFEGDENLKDHMEASDLRAALAKAGVR
jgi:hypothetical protein